MRIWLYGKPFSGKTTFASNIPTDFHTKIAPNEYFLLYNNIFVYNNQDVKL